MRKYIFSLFIFTSLLASCEDDNVNRELFEKKVLINQNGFREYRMNYILSSEADTSICVSVSGSKKANENVSVSLDINADTLAGYNWDKYRNDKSLYYELLPEECYHLEKTGIIIRAEEDYARIPVTFYLDKFDKRKKYILPISIVSVSEYTIAEPKYSTVLMYVVPANEFSGSFLLTGKITELGTSDYFDVRMTRFMRAEEKNSISMFAGNTAENNQDREKYRIKVTVQSDSSLTFEPVYPECIEISKTDDVVMDPENPKNRILVTKRTDTQNSRKVYITTTFSMFYEYVDKTDPSEPVTMRWEGSASRTEVNRLKYK